MLCEKPLLNGTKSHNHTRLYKTSFCNLVESPSATPPSKIKNFHIPFHRKPKPKPPHHYKNQTKNKHKPSNHLSHCQKQTHPPQKTTQIQ